MSGSSEQPAACNRAEGSISCALYVYSMAGRTARLLASGMGTASGSNGCVPLPRRLGRPGSGFSDGPPGAAEAKSGMGLAARMMEKMGWKEGQGLGKLRQGMVTPLVAQKTDARSGVIVNAEGPPEKRPRTGARPRACDVRGVGLGIGQRCLCRAWHAQGGPCGGGLVCALGLLGMHLPVGAMLRSSAGIFITDVRIGCSWLAGTCMAGLRGAGARRRGVPGRADARGAAAQHGRPRRRGRRPGGRGAPPPCHAGMLCHAHAWGATVLVDNDLEDGARRPLPCWHAVPCTCKESIVLGDAELGDGLGALCNADMLCHAHA